MKKMLTKFFGEVEVDESTLLQFDEGLWGFEGKSTYALISFDSEGDSLMCLQNAAQPDLAFVVLNPFKIWSGYEPVLDPADEKALGLEGDAPANFLAVVVVNETAEASTANLRCPIVVNAKTGAARQVMLPQEYPTRAPIAAAAKAGEG